MKKDDLKRARDILVRHGVLLRFSDLELFHGRVKKEGEKEWKVDPNFDNAGNNTGNRNINKRAALSTGSYRIAEEFADARLKDNLYNTENIGQNAGEFSTEVQRIVSNDEEAVIFNNNFSFRSLNNDQLEEVQEALKVMRNFGVSELAPLSFEERNLNKPIVDKIQSYMSHFQKGALTEEDIDKVHDKFIEEGKNIPKKLIFDIAQAINTKSILRNPENIRRIIDVYMSSDKGINLKLAGYPISEEYISAWLASNHIVGVSMLVDSATLGKRLDLYSLFDLNKINTQKVVGEKYQMMLSDYEEISRLVDSFNMHENMCAFLEKSTPEETMAKFRSRKVYNDLFKADAGVWEGFTVGEHTETTLRIFSDTYEDNVPKKLIPFVKLALISHDIGKGMTQENPYLNQEERNKKYSQKMFEELNIPNEAQEMLHFVIGESQNYTTEYFVRKNANAIDDLKKLTVKMLESTLKRKPTEKEVNGLVEVCKIMQVCDSGAYTRYAVTRKEGTNEYYYNGNDRFTQGFEKPTGINKRALKMREPLNGEF